MTRAGGMTLSSAARLVVLALLVCGLAVAARARFDPPHGLNSEYLPPDGFAAPALRTAPTPAITTERITQDWDGAPPDSFRARWVGFLTVLAPDHYTFATISDDASTIRIDGRVVVDNDGTQPTEVRSGRVFLDRGPHLIRIDYTQLGGAYLFEWTWQRDGRAVERVPAWTLTPTRVPLWSVVAVRAVDWVVAATLVLLACVAAILIWQRRVQVGAVLAPWPRAAALVLFVALAIVHTWPLAADPAHLSRNDNGDTVLNEWAIAWFAHQAPRAPLSLFDANMFYPERDTLAYSEAMIVQSAMGAPLLWLGLSPVLVYNLLIIAGFALTGWTTSLVVARWTGSWGAAVISGALAGVNAHTLTRLPHLQAQHAEFLPLALFALDLMLREPRVGHALRLALWFVLQALTSVYLLVFTAFALTAGALARPDDWWSRRFRPVATRALLAAAVAALALAPFMLPYWRAHTEQGMTRSLVDAEIFSAGLADYLATPSRLHYDWWSQTWFDGHTALFPGATGLCLAAVAILTGTAFRDRRARMCLAVGVCGVLLSLGPKLPGYETLYHYNPLLQAIRAPVRFGYLAIVSVALLAGFGMVHLRQRLSATTWQMAVPCVFLLIGAETLTAPLYLTPFDGIPAIYETLADEPHAVVVELPMAEWEEIHRNAPYLLNSTRHWQTLVNGYSGFAPPSYFEHLEAFRAFPQRDGVAAMQDVGVTHVFVHLDRYPPDTRRRLDASPDFEVLAEEGDILLLRLYRGASVTR
jgi:hypothetical protein